MLGTRRGAMLVLLPYVYRCYVVHELEELLTHMTTRSGDVRMSEVAGRRRKEKGRADRERVLEQE